MRTIPEKESLTIEFKSDRTKLPDSDIFEAVVAFSNTEGGDIYLGVEDDGEITGLDIAHGNPVQLNAYIANNTVPPVSVRTEIIKEEKEVLIISVPKSQNGIVATAAGKILRRRIKADGTPENIPMYPTEISTRLSDLRLLDYSSLVLNDSSVDDFDKIEIDRLRKTVLAYDGDKFLLEVTDEELFKALGFVREQGGILKPTITGILVLGRPEAIKRTIPTYSVSFQVLEGTRIRVNEDFVLPVLASIDRLNGFIEAWNPEREIEMGFFRMAAPDFNKRAIREAIVNAFSHRDYSRMGRIRILLADEGLTVANPGGFIEGISIDNLLIAEPHGRNPLLADALKRIGLAEKTGRGIDRIFEGSLIYGKLLPDYSASSSVAVSLFIPRSAPDVRLAKMISDEQKKDGRPLPLNVLLVLNALKETPKVSAEVIAESVKLPESVVRTVLERTVDSGMVEVFGSERKRRYSLSQSFYSEKGMSVGYSANKAAEETKFREIILNYVKEKGYISRSNVIELLRVSDNKAYKLLKKLRDEGELISENKGHYARYILPGKQRK